MRSLDGIDLLSLCYKSPPTGNLCLQIVTSLSMGPDGSEVGMQLRHDMKTSVLQITV